MVIAAGPWVRDFWDMLGLPKTVDIRQPDGDVAKGIKSFKSGMKDDDGDTTTTTSADPKVLGKGHDARMADEVRRDEPKA